MMDQDYCIWSMTGQDGAECTWVCTRHGETKTTYDGRSS